MNTYKIIFPYQSDTVHLASNEFEAFDKCYNEITNSGRTVPKVFVVFNMNTKIPYYLETGGSKSTPKSYGSQVNALTNAPTNTPTTNQAGGDLKDDVMNEPANSMKDVREHSDTLVKANDTTNVPLNPSTNSGFGQTANQNQAQVSQTNVLTPQLEFQAQRQELLERRIDYLESEMIRMMMKVDYLAGLSNQSTNMNNMREKQTPVVKENEKDSECCIQ